MTSQITGALTGNTIAATPRAGTPLAEATRILSETRIGDTNTHRVDFIEAALDKMADSDPALAAAVRAEVNKGLSPAEQGQLKALEPITVRDAGDGNTGKFGGPNSVSQDQWINDARAKGYAELKVYEAIAGATDNASIKRAMDDVYFGRVEPSKLAEIRATVAEKSWTDKVGDLLASVSPTGLIMEAAQPAIAALGRRAGLGNTEYGAKLQKILDTPGTIKAFNAGVATGMVNGAKGIVTDIASAAGKVVQFGADNSLLGVAGDAIRQATPDSIKNWLNKQGFGGALNEALPSSARGQASADAIAKTTANIADYFASKTPAQVGADIEKAIGKMWDGVKADYAKAAAAGPEAEARFFGEIVGRATFEVASTFVPVAGQVGKGAKLVQAADRVGDAVRVGDKVADGVRVADKAADGTRIAGKADDVGDASRVTKAAKSLSEIIAERKALATDFYKKQGFDPEKIPDHLSGINFERPVEVVKLKAGTVVQQYQIPGRPQGNYYARIGTTPDQLGIAAQALDRKTGQLVDKVATEYVLKQDVEVLQSTAASILDTWSIRGQSIQTSGGGTQLFTSMADAFEVVK